MCRKSSSSIEKWRDSSTKTTPATCGTKALIRKVDLLTSKENPPSYSEMHKMTAASNQTLHKIIHSDLGKILKKKRQLHAPKNSRRANRKSNCRRLYEKHLSGTKWEFVVSLDEALFFLQDCNGKRRVCYTKESSEVDQFVVEKKEKFGKRIMVVGAISGRGTLPLITVPPKVKVSAKYYVEYVLKPLLEKEIPKLCGEDASKVYVHHDAASSHTAKFTADYTD